MVNIPFKWSIIENAFSCQQTKQAVGVYSSAYNTRFDIFGHILHYPQKPIITTRFKKYTDVDKLPYGINAIVAICCYLWDIIKKMLLLLINQQLIEVYLNQFITELWFMKKKFLKVKKFILPIHYIKRMLLKFI